MPPRTSLVCGRHARSPGFPDPAIASSFAPPPALKIKTPRPEYEGQGFPKDAPTF